MSVAGLVFSLLLATALAAAYHLLFGRSLRQLTWLWLASLIGFAGGQLLAGLLPVELPHLGRLRPIEGAFASVLLMTIVKVSRL
ncbi:MAG: hypothetical protein HPY83_16225 [Anaerolineae bacterium]|nr:hypothetical protein [Anaerolineae bacterium]